MAGQDPEMMLKGMTLADRDTAYSLCRMAYAGDCRCERAGAVPCAPMEREVTEIAEILRKMRMAFAGGHPEQ